MMGRIVPPAPGMVAERAARRGLRAMREALTVRRISASR